MSEIRRKLLAQAKVNPIKLVRFPNVDLENISKTVYQRGYGAFNIASIFASKEVYGIEFYANNSNGTPVEIIALNIQNSVYTEYAVIKQIVIEYSGIHKIIFDSPYTLGINSYIGLKTNMYKQGLFYYNSSFYQSGSYASGENGCLFYAEFDYGEHWRKALYKAPIGIVLCYLVKQN